MSGGRGLSSRNRHWSNLDALGGMSGARLEPPVLPPADSVSVGRERYDAVEGKRAGPGTLVAKERGQQARQMGKVAGDEYVARLSAQSIAHPFRRIVRLKIARR